MKRKKKKMNYGRLNLKMIYLNDSDYEYELPGIIDGFARLDQSESDISQIMSIV